jgi:NADH:ubiquinone oxidoreductase subunit 3 (subunit A)
MNDNGNNTTNLAKSITMDLENLQKNYSNLVIQYKQAVADYINYLNLQAQQPCGKYNKDSKNIDQKCYEYIWSKAGCSTTGMVSASSSWAKDQTLNGLIYDSYLWSTMTDYNHRMGCYGNSGNKYFIIGVGTDGNLYSRPGLDAPWSRINDDSNGNIITIFTGPDGNTIYCTNVSKEIWYKSSWNAPNWQGPIPGSCCVISAAMGQDSTIVGVGTDNKLWSRSLNGGWSQTASPGEWCAYVTIGPNGKLFVVGGGNQIWSKNSYKNLTSQGWTGQGSCCVKAITIAPDGTFIGVGTDNQLYTKSNYNNLSTNWNGPYNSYYGSCCVTSITTVVNKDYNSSQFNSASQPNYKLNSQPLVNISGFAFTGSGSAGQSIATTLTECQAQCNSNPNCSGATFVSNQCQLRTGEGQIVPSSNTSYAIIPKGKQLLLNMEKINQQLISTNNQIKSKISVSQPTYYDIKGNVDQKSNELQKNYNDLMTERNNIKKLLDEYETLNRTDDENQIKITQNYYTYILLFILVAAIIFLLIKFNLPSTSGTTSTIQYGGELGINTYFIIYAIIVAIILINFSINYLFI